MPLFSHGNTRPKCKGNSVTLKKLKDKYYFMNMSDSPRTRRSARQASWSGAGNKWCPWKWVSVKNTKYIPSQLAQARCDNCDMAVCKPIEMYYPVLTWESQCDPKTDDSYRKWTSVRIRIAYIYTGNLN